jgi:hypothetical protein
MTGKDATTFVLGGVVVGAIVIAFFLLLGDKEPPPMRWVKPCTSDAECRDPWTCVGSCMHCQESLKVCVYDMKDVETCICVEGEQKACDGGHQTCMKDEKQADTTYWGPCEK